MKYLLVGVVLYVAWRVWRSKRLRRHQAMQQQLQELAQQVQRLRQQAGQWRGAAAPVTVTVACVHCGVHVPQVEGVYCNGQWYCGDAHARAGAAAGRGQ